MRKFDELSDHDKGIYEVRKQIKAMITSDHYCANFGEILGNTVANATLKNCIDLCDLLLDISTLGEIE
jgi:hypothetical protein